MEIIRSVEMATCVETFPNICSYHMCNIRGHELSWAVMRPTLWVLWAPGLMHDVQL